MGGRLFGGADHGEQDVGLERRAWTLAQAVSGSVGSQTAATNVPALRVGTDPVLATARAFSRWRSGLDLVMPGRWRRNRWFKRISWWAAAMRARYPRKVRI